MVMPYTLVQVLLAPLVFAPIAYAAGRKTEKQTGWLIALPRKITFISWVMTGYCLSKGGRIAIAGKTI